MKTHDWKPVSGLIHPHIDAANEERLATQKEWPNTQMRVRYTLRGYQVQIRLPRRGTRCYEAETHRTCRYSHDWFRGEATHR